MRKLKKQIVLLIVMLLTCSSSWSQNEKGDSITSTGGSEVIYVSIPVTYIRLANIKLIQAKADAQLKEQFKTIIETYKTETEILNNTIDRQKYIIAEAESFNKQLDEVNNRLKKQRNILVCSNVITILLLILL